MEGLRIGSCSWKFPSWEGLVYSAREGIDYLAEYAERFNTVEIDQWFWSLFGPDSIGMPKVEDVARYLAAVGTDFRFTVKVPNSVTLTHFYKRDARHGGKGNPYFLSVPLMLDFLSYIEPMRQQTAALMFQFEYLNKQKMKNITAFKERLAPFLEELPDAWTYGVETRNPQYLTENFFEFLYKHGLATVLVDGYYLPPVSQTFETARRWLRDPVIIRLMGPDRQGIEKITKKKWDEVVQPMDETLDRVADMVRTLVADGHQVIVNINNHFEGSAPITIRKLQERLE
ncbi:MAG: DUF72 domain-containing protein [Spirochaetes bacterium]|jgi:uncharacterized protein YecE (DUF72 family)|nr:DUF72 domain-containing protein [Spirochaetota bacterium]